MIDDCHKVRTTSEVFRKETDWVELLDYTRFPLPAEVDNDELDRLQYDLNKKT